MSNGNQPPEIPSAGGSNPYESPPPSASTPSAPSDVQAHRGPLVLVLGILSIPPLFTAICCRLTFLMSLALGVPAGVLGVYDLKQMKEGKMDPAGRQLTMAGMIIGFIGGALALLGGVVMTILIVIDAVANA